MIRTVLAVLTCAALACAALGASAQQQPAAPNLVDKLMAAERGGLSDSGAGRLYKPAADLLAAARDLPQSIELKLPAVPAEAEPPKAEQAAAAPLPIPVQQPQAGPPWLHVVEGPVVDEETLAYTRFQAGDYVGASALYARLHEQHPDDLHFLQMLFLSTRNAGDAKAAAPLLAALKSKPESRAWADWITAMAALSSDQGGAQKPPQKEAK